MKFVTKLVVCVPSQGLSQLRGEITTRKQTKPNHPYRTDGAEAVTHRSANVMRFYCDAYAS